MILRGNTSLRDLTAEEALQYGSYTQMFFDIVENYLRLIRQLGLASEEKVLRSIVSRRLAAAGTMQWWQENQADYSSETVNWIRRVTEQRVLAKSMSVRGEQITPSRSQYHILVVEGPRERQRSLAGRRRRVRRLLIVMPSEKPIGFASGGWVLFIRLFSTWPRKSLPKR